VLITGSSSGIGLEMARQFAMRGHPLILTARIQSELDNVARELESTHRVEVDTIAGNLQEPGACEAIADAVRQSGKEVNILVNNAGLGQRGNFWEYAMDRDEAMLHVNIEAVVRLTKLFLPQMIERKTGRILNTASVAGFEPGPLLAVYHATKAFVLSFTEALRIELEDKRVSVTALCPGATDTDFFPKASMQQTKAFQKTKVMAPQEVAEIAYRALMRGDPICVVGGMNTAMVFARRFMPIPAQARLSKKLYEDAPQESRKRRRGDIEKAAAPNFRKSRLARRAS